MKRVLVTGGSGFIGRHTLPLLKENDFEVHVASLNALDDTCIWHACDLLKPDERKQLMAEVQPTHILHFAWIATPGEYWTSELNEQWKTATEHLLHLSKEHGAARFVGVGTCAEYDWSAGECRESTSLNPSTPYGKAKAETGQMVVSETDLSTAWGRLFHLYGPHEHPKRLVPSVINSLLSDKRAQCSHGEQLRDFLHVHDAARAFTELLMSDVTGAINIASGTSVTIKQVVQTIADQMDASDKVDFGAMKTPDNDPPKLTANVERLRNELKWKPEFDLESGIANTIEWWRQQ